MPRRVYELDQAIINGIERFRHREKLDTEVAAVRVLLTRALTEQGTLDDLIKHFEDTKDARVFFGHPLVATIHQENGDLEKVVLRDGSTLFILDGEVARG